MWRATLLGVIGLVGCGSSAKPLCDPSRFIDYCDGNAVMVCQRAHSDDADGHVERRPCHDGDTCDEGPMHDQAMCTPPGEID